MSLFESEGRAGGHANTVFVSDRDEEVPIDTGFLVFNDLTYPNLVGFFKELKVPAVETAMTLSIQIEKDGIEWAGNNLSTVFAQKKNLLKPKFWKLLQEIIRFHKDADRNLEYAKQTKCSLRELIQNRNYSQILLDWYVLPMGGAIWSSSPKQMLDFPARAYMQFCLNHRMLQVEGRPMWKTVDGGSIRYVEKVCTALKDLRLNSRIDSVERTKDGIYVHGNKSEKFDQVVFATHAPTTAKLLLNQDSEEKKILTSFKINKNKISLHTDHKVMPLTKNIWSAWNVISRNLPNEENRMELTYWCNALQPIANWGATKDYFVTLNPIDTRNAILEIPYNHPIFDEAAISAQEKLPSIQGRGGIYYCGAWTRFGFHEDGIMSAVQVAKLLGVDVPW